MLPTAQEAPEQALAADARDEEHKRVGKKARDDELFLAELRGQLVDHRVEADRDEGHGGGEHEGPGVLDLHELGLIEGKTGLEQGQGEEVDHIGIDKAPELPVLESLEQRGECRRG